MNNTETKEWEFPEIKDGIPTKYGWTVKCPENLILGRDTDIGFGTYIQAEYMVIIEPHVQIGSHCSIYSRNSIDNTAGIIHIQYGASIGAGSVILPRVDGKPLIIGKNSKIGALTLIKNSVSPNSIVVGSPAHYILKDYNIIKRKDYYE